MRPSIVRRRGKGLVTSCRLECMRKVGNGMGLGGRLLTDKAALKSHGAIFRAASK
jgi:hypothetical protein